MKRNFDLIRSMLQDIENLPPGGVANSFSFEGTPSDVIAAHAVLLLEAGLVKGSARNPLRGGPPPFHISALTWEGHDFLAAAKNDAIWDRAKKTVLVPAAGATWAVVLEWLKAESLKTFGLA